MERYYYKTQDGKGYLSLKSPATGYIQITKEEFEEHNKIPEPTAEQKAQIEKDNRIRQLKNELATYDYIGVKIAMGVATKEEYSKEIAYTETLREQIRELEK